MLLNWWKTPMVLIKWEKIDGGRCKLKRGTKIWQKRQIQRQKCFFRTCLLGCTGAVVHSSIHECINTTRMRVGTTTKLGSLWLTHLLDWKSGGGVTWWKKVESNALVPSRFDDILMSDTLETLAAYKMAACKLAHSYPGKGWNLKLEKKWDHERQGGP